MLILFSSSSYSTMALSVWPWLPLYPSGIFCVVSEQFNFSGLGLLAPCPTPNYPGEPMIFLSGLSPLADQSQF